MRSDPLGQVVGLADGQQRVDKHRVSLARDQRGVSDFHTGDVGDGVQRAGRTVEGDAKIASAGFGLGERERG